MIGGMATAIGLADDLGSGIIDRFRSLPMARSAVLAGRTLADLGRSVFSLTLMVGLGLLVGFHFHAGVGAIVAGLALVIFFGYCFSWVYATIGLLTRDPETAQVAGILPVLHPRVRKLGHRAGRNHAELAAALCPTTSRSASPSTRCARCCGANRRTIGYGSRSPGLPGSSWSSSRSPCVSTATSPPE